MVGKERDWALRLNHLGDNSLNW